LLQVLDDGRITDGQGRTVDFTNTVLIMTSNIGSQYIMDESNVEQREAKISEALKAHFRPEFLNRIDETVIFDRLDKSELGSIIKIQLERVKQRLLKQGIDIELTPEATDYLADKGYDPVYGARPLKRAIQKYLLDPLSMAVLEGDYSEGDVIKVRLIDEQLSFTK
jgi:ATP-dependent Clp protease ATP-binding subunit ClpB